MQPDNASSHAVYRSISGTPTLTIRGEIDMATVPVLARHLNNCLTGSGTPPVVVVDLSHVDFLDAAGLSLLVDVHQRAHAQHTELRIVANTRPALRPVTLTGLDQRLRIHPTLSEALAPG